MADNAAQRSFFVSLLAVLSLCCGGCFKKRVPAKKNKSCKLFGWLRGRFGRRGKPKNIKQNSKPEHIQEIPEKAASVQNESETRSSIHEECEKRVIVQNEPETRSSIHEGCEKRARVQDEPETRSSIHEKCEKRASGHEKLEKRDSVMEESNKTASVEEPEKRTSTEEERVKRASGEEIPDETASEEEPDKTDIVKEPAKTTSIEEEPVKRDNGQEKQEKTESAQKEPDKTACVEEEPDKMPSTEEDPVKTDRGKQKPEKVESGQEEPVKRASVVIEAEKTASTQQPDLQERKTIPVKRRTRNRKYLRKIKELVTPGDPNARYDVTNKIGEGVYGSVYKAKDLLNSGIVAIKKIWVCQQSQQKQALEEIVALSSNKHPNITSYRESYLVFDELWIVMEYVDGGCLRDISTSTRMEEGHIATVARECLQALQFLHQNKVIHRDVKTENILFGLDGSIKLADFGLCANLSEDECERVSYVGTPHMMAPEIVTDKEYSFKVDVWSLGISILEMQDHEHPFLAQSSSDALDFIAHTGKPKINRENLSKEINDFLDKCLEVDSATRSSASELLAHPFLQIASSVENLRNLIKDVKQASPKEI